MIIPGNALGLINLLILDRILQHHAGAHLADMGALETTFRMIKAETQLLYSSDYPHWDFDLPSTIYDLPFLTETAKRNILGGNAARLFGLDLGGKLAKVA